MFRSADEEDASTPVPTDADSPPLSDDGNAARTRWVLTAKANSQTIPRRCFQSTLIGRPTSREISAWHPRVLLFRSSTVLAQPSPFSPTLRPFLRSSYPRPLQPFEIFRRRHPREDFGLRIKEVIGKIMFLGIAYYTDLYFYTRWYLKWFRGSLNQETLRQSDQ